MGGADHSNITIEILNVLESFPDLFANVVTTTANAHLTELKAYVSDSKKIALHVNTDKVARLMHEADFAIITPSVTVNEALYMELPLIAIQTAKNQDEIYTYLKERKYLTIKIFDANKLCAYIEKILGISF